MARRWLAFHSHQKEKNEALRHVWNTLSASADSTTCEALQRVRQKAARAGGNGKHVTGRLLKYAAAIIIVVMAGTGIRMVTGGDSKDGAGMAVCHVPNGKNIHLILYDGTAVTLNAGAELRYPRQSTGGKRMVYLRGEGMFSVVHHASEPFIVRAGNVNIEDVGTRFNVKTLSRGEVVATVSEGEVKINAGGRGRNVNLTAGQQAVCSAQTGEISVAHADTLQAMAWTKGSLVFNKSRLEDIVTDLKHKYNINIVVSPRLAMNQTFTVQFNGNETIGEVLSLLAGMGNMRYHARGNTVWLVPK